MDSRFGLCFALWGSKSTELINLALAFSYILDNIYTLYRNQGNDHETNCLSYDFSIICMLPRLWGIYV